MANIRLVAVDELHDFCRSALTRAGAIAEHADIAAEALTLTDSWGVFTHGSKLLPGYVRRLRAGGIRGDAKPRVIAEGLAWAIVDGASALGQVIGVRAPWTRRSPGRGGPGSPMSESETATTSERRASTRLARPEPAWWGSRWPTTRRALPRRALAGRSRAPIQGLRHPRRVGRSHPVGHRDEHCCGW